MGALALATLAASPSSLTFAERCVRTRADSRVVTINNDSGSEATDVRVSISPPAVAEVFPLAGATALPSLAAGEKEEFSVGFRPGRAGTTTGVAVITYTTTEVASSKKPSPSPTERTTTVGLSGSGIDRFLDAAPRALNFGSSRVGRSVNAKRVTIYDDGASPLTITGLSLTGRHPGDFTLSRRGSFTVTDGAPAQVTIDFTPRGVGARASELVIRSNSCTDPVVRVALAGIGTEPDITARPARVDLGQVELGGNATTDVIIANQGQAPLRISRIQLFGVDRESFTMSKVPSVPRDLSGGRSFVFTLRFNAEEIGLRTASLRFRSNDPDSRTFVVPIRAEGIVPPTPTPTATASVVPTSSAAPPSNGLGFRVALAPYVPEILVSAAVLAFFIALVTIRRVRGIPE